MELRWCWAAFLLLSVVSHTAVTHNTASVESVTKTSNSKRKDSSFDPDPVNLSNKSEKRYSSSTSKSSLEKNDDELKQEVESNYNFDEIIASTEAIATKSLKKYLLKENKKYRKKYVSNDDYRQQTSQYRNEPLAPEHRESPLAEDAATTAHKIASESEKPHSRKKRLIWVTDDGRLALPPGTSLTIAPTIALPFVRYPPTGFLSNISISLPVTIDFDKLGLTDNQNPLGVLPPLLARSMGRAAGSILADYVSDYMRTRRRRRSTPNVSGNENFKITTEFIDDNEPHAPKLPDEHKDAFHGGERALLYTVVEDFIANFGVDGKACMLRAICEVHSKPVERFGLIGEMLKLFFTASLSPYSEHLDEYVLAETVGKGETSPGECFPYYKDCPKSLFRMVNSFQQRYKEDVVQEHTHNSLYENEIHDGFEREMRSVSSSESKDETVIQLDNGINKLAM